ncbi:IS3 family transposase [Paraclostridium bifermentans]|nr:IS3 family transposase [Paraclostridium bifermentans]
MENEVIKNEIIKIYDKVNGIYGYRRMTMNINRSLKKIYNHKRIYRLMKSLKLKSVIRRKKKGISKVYLK